MSLWKKISELESAGTSFVLVTMTSARGSVPQNPGAKILVTRDGLLEGTIGGGRVEAAAIKSSQELLTSDSQCSPITVTWNLRQDLGMTCGGELTLLFEHFLVDSWPIVIFGAGHVAQALTRVLSQLNCQVTCIDPRTEWTDQLEGVKVITHANPCETVRVFNDRCFFISMTQGHTFDLPILKSIAEHFPKAPYVGVIGSRSKGAKIKSELRKEGVPEDFISNLKVPIGIPLGSNEPGEIAISICAEMIQVRDSFKND